MTMILVATGFIAGALHWLESLYAQHGYLIMAVLVGGESAGLPLPGETSLLAGAVEAQRGILDVYWVMAVGAAAAIVGDNIGYWVGRRAGRPLLRRYGRFIHVRDKEIRVLDYYFSRHGAKTVFFGRWVVVLRVGAAVFAGASRMSWRRFAFWNAMGSAAWAVSVTLLGFYFYASLSAVKTTFGYVGIAAFVAFIVAAYLFVRRTERRLFARIGDEEAGSLDRAGEDKTPAATEPGPHAASSAVDDGAGEGPGRAA